MENLANACPFEAGPGVYHARGVLMAFTGKVYHNACETYTSPAPPKSGLRIKSLIDKNENIRIYPNPAKDLLTVSLNLNRSDQSVLQLMDLQGRRVLEKAIIDGNNQIELQELPNSLYLYHIRLNGKIIKSDKLIIQ